MPTNEAGLSGGNDQGDGGRTTASDTPGGEKNPGPNDNAGSSPSGGQAGSGTAGHDVDMQELNTGEG